MPATPISNPNKYFHRGKTKVYFVASISAIGSTTRSELNAGTDLSPVVSGADGWAVAGSKIETPNLSSEFTPSIAGSTQVGDPKLECDADQQGDDVRTLLPRGTTGFIVILWGGDVAGNKMDVFPVEVLSVEKPLDMADAAAKVTIGFAITLPPAVDIEVPS